MQFVNINDIFYFFTLSSILFDKKGIKLYGKNNMSLTRVKKIHLRYFIMRRSQHAKKISHLKINAMQSLRKMWG